MASIERLDISYNHIISMPDLSGMTALSELDVQDNVLEDFPWELLDKPNMKLMIVKNNNFILTKEEEQMMLDWKNEAGQEGLVVIF
jgi:Leucine-rich repeat (LRR) protein